MENREAIITVVGFLGVGKTTLLKHLVNHYIDQAWDPYVILNDYENAHLDAQQFFRQIESRSLIPLSGSCICCSGINELRSFVNTIPERPGGITLIEANGTSDACSLMGFLGVGLSDRYLPPVQISVVDVKNWQKRAEHNDLEANQIQVSSLIVLTHVEDTSEERQEVVVKHLRRLNPLAEVITMDEIDGTLLPQLTPSNNEAQKLDHLKAHWASCSVDLPRLPDSNSIHAICNALPKSILRVKGCTQTGDEEQYTYFERTPDGKVRVRPFYGIPTTGTKLLCVGPGSEPSLLEKAIQSSMLLDNGGSTS